MSYSFTLTAASRGEAKVLVQARLDAIMLASPEHQKDLPAVGRAIAALIDALEYEHDTLNHVSVHCYGGVGLSCQNPDEAPLMSIVNAYIQVGLINAPA